MEMKKEETMRRTSVEMMMKSTKTVAVKQTMKTMYGRMNM